MNPAPIDETIVTLNHIVRAVSYAVEAGTVIEALERIADAARQLLKAEYAALGVPDGEGGLAHFVTSGIDEETREGISHYPQGHGLLGAIMHNRETIRLPNMYEDERSVGFPEGHPPMTSFLGVPIMVGSQLFGMLYLSDRKDGLPFSERDERLVETIAGYAALAIAGAQLRNQQSRIALLEERERIAMALHDGIIQELYAIGMHLELLRGEGPIDPDALKPILGSLNTVIDDIRSYIMDLRATSYRQQTVRSCLSDIVRRLRLEENIAVHMDAPNREPPVSPVTFEAVCQITNEAVSNAKRHANADNLWITAELEGQWFSITVEDDGVGFDISDDALRLGMGLRNIRQRASLHGGTVEISSTPRVGTIVTLKVPSLPMANGTRADT